MSCRLAAAGEGVGEDSLGIWAWVWRLSWTRKDRDCWVGKMECVLLECVKSWTRDSRWGAWVSSNISCLPSFFFFFFSSVALRPEERGYIGWNRSCKVTYETGSASMASIM